MCVCEIGQVLFYMDAEMIGPCTVAVQAGLLTPLTFAQHHLSPLAAFTSDVYFLHNGRQ